MLAYDWPLLSHPKHNQYNLQVHHHFIQRSLVQLLIGLPRSGQRDHHLVSSHPHRPCHRHAYLSIACLFSLEAPYPRLSTSSVRCLSLEHMRARLSAIFCYLWLSLTDIGRHAARIARIGGYGAYCCMAC